METSCQGWSFIFYTAHWGRGVENSMQASLLPVTVIFVPGTQVQEVNLSDLSVFLQRPGKGQHLTSPVTPTFPFPTPPKDSLQGQVDPRALLQVTSCGPSPSFLNSLRPFPQLQTKYKSAMPPFCGHFKDNKRTCSRSM